MDKLIHDIIFIGSGLPLTLMLLVSSLLLGASLGVLLSVMSYSKLTKLFVERYVSVLRGTPLLLQLSLVYFSAPAILGVKLSVLTSGILAFGINSSAYITEIFRAGIESVPKCQFEAAQTLEIPKHLMWKDIILPQALRNVFPSFINEVIALLKETALIGSISGMDIARTSQVLGAEQFTYFVPLCIAAAYYYVLVLIIEYFGKTVERMGWYAKS